MGADAMRRRTAVGSPSRFGFLPWHLRPLFFRLAARGEVRGPYGAVPSFDDKPLRQPPAPSRSAFLRTSTVRKSCIVSKSVSVISSS